MTSFRDRLPSRAHAAGLLAGAAALALAAVSPALAAVPLALFLLACAAAPFYPGWQFFLTVKTRGPRGSVAVALTFDDGPDARALPPLLELLRRHRAPAAFFVVGERAAAHPELIAAIRDAGHEIGNHSQTHDPLLMFRSVARLRAEVARCQETLAAHGLRPRAFRPPVGITNPRLAGVLRELGLGCVAFSNRPLDFGNRRLEGLAGRVLRRVRGGDVILLHDLLPRPAALGPWLAEVAAVLEGLEARGIPVVPLSALLGEPVVEPAGGAAPAAPARPPLLGRVAAGLQAALLVAYPLLVLLAVERFGARGAALLLLALLVPGLVRAVVQGGPQARTAVGLGAAVALLLGIAALLDDTRWMLAYPSLVNGALLAQFAWSLRRGPPTAERFARMQVPDLLPEEVRYCRTVTGVWVAFFAANGAAVTALALWAPRSWWGVYAGGLSYLLVGLLFAAEYVVRKARFGRFGSGPVDRLLAALLRRTAAP